MFGHGTPSQFSSNIYIFSLATWICAPVDQPYEVRYAVTYPNELNTAVSPGLGSYGNPIHDEVTPIIEIDKTEVSKHNLIS